MFQIEILGGYFRTASQHRNHWDFLNHPNLTKIYLPDGYEGNPMLKSFELISREVKPWPGEVDVEGMPEDGKKDEGES